MRASRVCAGMLVAAALLMFSSASQAGSLPKGTLEVSAYGLFDYSSYSADGDDAGSSTDFTLTGDLGYSVTDLLEVFGGLLIQHSSVDPVGAASVSQTAVGPEAGLTLNFKTSSIVVPYITGAVGLVAYSGDVLDNYSTGWMVPFLGAGIRVLVGNSAAFNFGLGYVHNIHATGAEDLTSDSIQVSVGISAFPKKPAPAGHSRH
jgi:hypothetical protein